MKGVGGKIIESVSEVMGIEIDTFLSHTRKQNVVAARIIAVRLIKELTCLGEHDIAELLNKNRASVHYYIGSFRPRYDYEPRFRNMYETCKKHIKEGML